MSTPDFETVASLRARNLASHVPPEGGTESEGEDVELTHEQTRRGLPTKMQPGRRYDDVAIQKRVLGFVVGRRR